MEWFEDGDSLWDYCETKTINEEFANEALKRLQQRNRDEELENL